MKYLPLYKEWMLNGRIHDNGLCWSVRIKNALHEKDTLLELFKPDNVRDDYPYNYWAYSALDSDYDLVDSPLISTKFTELRQTIILFMAAMNGEL